MTKQAIAVGGFVLALIIASVPAPPPAPATPTTPPPIRG